MVRPKNLRIEPTGDGGSKRGVCGSRLNSSRRLWFAELYSDGGVLGLGGRLQDGSGDGDSGSLSSSDFGSFKFAGKLILKGPASGAGGRVVEDATGTTVG